MHNQKKARLTVCLSSKENQKVKRKREFMIFSGYWVSIACGKAVLERAVFDETKLAPATKWKQAWQNQDGEARCKGYVDLEAALSFAAQMLSAAEGTLKNDEEMTAKEVAIKNKNEHLVPLFS